MKNFNKLLWVLAGMLSLFSCAGNKSDTQPVAKKNQIVVELNSHETIKTDKETIQLVVYGYDKMLADKEASIVATQTAVLNEMPKMVTIDLPDNPASKISPALSSPENAAYYLSLKDEEGLYTIDYNFAFPSVDISSKDPQIFYIKKK